MTETNNCVEKDALIDYLYGEVDAHARTRVDAHLRICEQCADEIRELKEVRGTLDAWAPPEAELGFRVVSDADPMPAPVSLWGRLRRPAWGLATAAVLVLATGWAITKPVLELEQGEMVLRIGWRDPPSDSVAPPAQRNAATRFDRATPSAEPQLVRGTTDGAAGDAADDELLLRVRQLEEELRKANLSELERAFGEFEGTGAERARQQLLDSLRRVSAR